MKICRIHGLAFALFTPLAALGAPWVPAEGASFDAKVTQSSRCGPPRPNEILCWKLSIKTAAGQVLSPLHLYQFAKVVNAAGKATYAHPALKPDGSMGREIPEGSPEAKKMNASFYAAAGQLKSGASVRIKIMTCMAPHTPQGRTECEASSVQLLK